MDRTAKKIITFITLLTLLFSCSTTSAFAIATPAAEVVYRYGDTSLTKADFESQVATAINNQISSAGISSKNVSYTNLLSTDANAGDVNAWTVYGHGDVQWPSTYPYPGGTFTPPTDKQHIQISSDGASMTFNGYTSNPYNDFLLYNNEVSGEKTFNFTLDETKIYYHSMLGGGFLFNATTAGGVLSGYLVLYQTSSVNLYKLVDVNIAALHDSPYGTPLTAVSGVTSVTSVSRSSGTPGLIDVSIVVNPSLTTPSSTILNLTSNNVKLFNDYELTTSFGERFGPFASFSSHGCSDVSIFGFNNLQMSITSVQTFTETLHEYVWGNAPNNFFVNIDNDSTAYASEPTSSGMIADLTSNGAYYIGVGVSTNEAISDVFTNNNKGIYITIPLSTVYERIGELISADIISEFKLSDLSATAGNQLATLSFSPPEGVADGDVIIEQSIDGISFTPAAIETSITSTSTSAVISGLTNGQQYWFRLNIGSGKYEGYSNIATATPKTSSHSAPPPVVVIVNGEEQNAGTQTQTFLDGVRTTTVDVNENTVNNKMDAVLSDLNNPEDNIIEVPVKTGTGNDISVSISSELVDRMNTDHFDLKISTEGTSYLIPSEALLIKEAAGKLGSSNDLGNVEIVIKISHPSNDQTVLINEHAQALDYEIVIPPLNFEVLAMNKTTGEKVTITKFSNFTQRFFEIPAGVDPSKITTGIVYNADGTFSHIPTEIVKIDGKYYAKLNSLTNSTYSVVWNPITVNSVENHWSKTAVNDMASRLVISDPESFDPKEKITRGEFAEYITKALGVYRTEVAIDGLFKDVTKDNPLGDAIKTAVEYGIIKGYTDGNFKPNTTITREEAMVMYNRAMHVTKLKASELNRYKNYSDFSAVAKWASEDVKQVLAAKVFNGISATKLAPKSTFTTAEAATAVRNLLVQSELINE